MNEEIGCLGIGSVVKREHESAEMVLVDSTMADTPNIFFPIKSLSILIEEKWD